VSCDGETGPGLGDEPKTGKHEDRKRKPEELKPINRNEIAQQCVASLKDAEHPEIDEPEKFRAGSILKGTRANSAQSVAAKSASGPRNCNLKRRFIRRAISQRRLACLKASPRHTVQRDIRRIDLFAGLIFSRFSKPNTGATAVLVDELDARILKGASYDLKGCATRLTPLFFELVDSHDADACTISQVLLAPAK